jgi:3-isopropylmalate dehydrogenase
MSQDKANPLAAVLSGSLMLDWLAELSGNSNMADAAQIIEHAVSRGFHDRQLRPMEFGGDMGLTEMTGALLSLVQTVSVEGRS